MNNSIIGFFISMIAIKIYEKNEVFDYFPINSLPTRIGKETLWDILQYIGIFFTLHAPVYETLNRLRLSIAE